MSKITNVMIGLLEEQAALLLRHIHVLKNLPHDGSEGSAAVVVEGKKKAKAPVDPNKPKRPLSGYQLFMADHNGEYKEKNPEANATTIMTMVAGAWSVLTPEQKETYLVRAEKLKEQYLVEMQKYVANQFKDSTAEVGGDVEVPAPKVKASKTAASSSSAAEPKKVAPVAAPTPVPVAAPAITPKKDEEKSKKHKRSDSDDSEAVIFTAPETHDTDKKKKKHKKDKK